MTRKIFALLFLLAAINTTLLGQDNFFAKWESRTSATQARQPTWPPPLISPYPMLIQVFRADFTRQITPALTSTWNYGASRGLNLIPGFNSEVDVYYAPYIQHNTPKAIDGFGDVGFLYKYRILSRNEKDGNYMLSAQLTATIPTGSHSNGSPDSSVSPTLLSGKGFGKFNVISCLGGTLPTEETNKVGRSIAWNTTAQYHISKYVWPELESNATYFFAGKNDGKKQNFVTPGIVFSKFKLRPSDETSRVGVAFGAGMQIATSQFHTYNHELAFTSRLVF
jgi:Putative MetA-pathway of phenol degradation